MKTESKATETQKSKPFRSLGSPKQSVAPFTGLGHSLSAHEYLANQLQDRGLTMVASSAGSFTLDPPRDSRAVSPIQLRTR